MSAVRRYYCDGGKGAMYETDSTEADDHFGLYVEYAALLAQSAAYEALVAGCSELAAKFDRQAVENYTDRGNALSRCADDVRRLLPEAPARTSGAQPASGDGDE